MHALATGDLAAAEQLIARTAADRRRGAPNPTSRPCSTSCARCDALVVGDLVALADEAAAHEAFGAAEGIPSVIGRRPPACGWRPASPTGPRCWSASSWPGGVDGVARDVDFLLTMTCVVGVAAATWR